jgi:hypothetical protein
MISVIVTLYLVFSAIPFVRLIQNALERTLKTVLSVRTHGCTFTGMQHQFDNDH